VPLTDTSITEWAIVTDTNDPTDHELIAGLLDDQARMVKSVNRAEAENRGWVRQGLPGTWISATSFSLAGDKRLIAAPSRRVRATITGAVRYGTIRSSSYAAGVTTIVVDWDPAVYNANAYIVASDTITFAGVNILSLFAVGQRLEFWNLTTGSRKVRTISALTFALGATIVQFTSGDPYIPLTSGDTVLMIPSTGIDNTLSEVMFGTITPDLLQSGWPNSMLGGSFQVVFNGTTGPFLINLPVLQHDGSYIPQVQSSRIVIGTPSSVQWTKPIIATRLGGRFELTLPTAITGATVAYDWLLLR